MANHMKTNASNHYNNNNNNDFRIRLRNENDMNGGHRSNHPRNQFPQMNDHKVLPPQQPPQPMTTMAALNAYRRRTPSPPKCRVLSAADNLFNRQLFSGVSLSQAKPSVPSMVSSTTKSCYTGFSSQMDGFRAPVTAGRTLDCSGRLKRLEESGLIERFRNFNTKSIPLALEEEEESDDIEIIDEKQHKRDDANEGNDTIELKSSEEFEPLFVSQIRDEVRKISTHSFGSQSGSQRAQRVASDLCYDNNAKRKSSNSVNNKSQNCSTNGSNKWSKTVANVSAKSNSSNLRVSSRKSKSNEDIKGDNCKTRENRKSSLSRGKSEESVHNKSRERRSQSSNGRLSGSGYDKHNDNNNKVNASQRSVSNRCPAMASGDQSKQSNGNHNNSNNNINNNNNVNKSGKSDTKTSLTDNSNALRDKSIRKLKVNNKYYQILNCIGQGGSSKVYQVYDPEEQRTLAIKIVDLSRADEQTVCGYKNEITLLDKLASCKRVVRMYAHEYQNNGQQLLVVMEKGDSDLNNVLKSFMESEEKRSLDSHLVRFYWQQMLKSVDEIHAKGVVHSDLKPVNFILVAGKLKLIDFGIANAIQANYTSVYKESQIGTINYMAPEALQNRSDIRGKTVIKYNCKADVWSLGCILYTLVYGRTPFHHLNNLFQKASAILDPNHQINYPPIDDHLLLDCIQKCLQRDPNKRPTTKELLSHRYLMDSKAPTVRPRGDSQNALISQINNLTPNRIKQLSQVLEKLSKH